MSPGEEIRAAAARIREVATGTAIAPWFYDQHGEIHNRGVTVAERVELADAEHITLWDPIVAELVAAQLDLWAESFEDIDVKWIDTWLSRHEQAALALARAINGGAS